MYTKRWPVSAVGSTGEKIMMIIIQEKRRDKGMVVKIQEDGGGEQGLIPTQYYVWYWHYSS